VEYLGIEWKHDDPDDPILLYSELDDDRWELRKVEVYRDGRKDYAGPAGSSGSTGLGEVPMPSLASILRQPQFAGGEITATEFEQVWREATREKRGPRRRDGASR
jgi:hypothetical protein